MTKSNETFDAIQATIYGLQGKLLTRPHWQPGSYRKFDVKRNNWVDSEGFCEIPPYACSIGPWTFYTPPPKPLVFEVGKYYKTRGGDVVRVWAIAPNWLTADFPVKGRVTSRKEMASWTLAGCYSVANFETSRDLICECDENGVEL